MKLKIFFTVAVLMGFVLLTGCTTSSSSALMRICTYTENGWEMSVQKLNGTDVINLSRAVGGEAYTANVAVGVENGAVTVEFRDKSGKAVYTSEKLTESGTVTAKLDGNAYNMALIADDFGGTVEVEVVK